MSIMGMQRKFRRHSWIIKIVFGSIFILFALGAFQGFGPSGGGGGGGVAGGSPAPDPIATVDGTDIPRSAFNRVLAQQANMIGRSPDPSLLSMLKQMAFNNGERSVVVSILLDQEAQRRGVRISTGEVSRRIDEAVENSVLMAQGSYPSRKRFQRDIEKNYGSLDNYKAELRKGMEENREEIRKSAAIEELKKRITAEVKVTEKDYLESLKKLQIRQIFIKTKTPPPVDAKAKGKTETSANPDGEARQEATDLLKEIQQHPDKFEFFARQRSDELIWDSKKNKQVAAAETGGLIGWVGRDQKKFEYGEDWEASVWKTKPGQMVDHVIKAATGGYYIVKVEDSKTDYPKDYDKVSYLCEGPKQKDDAEKAKEGKSGPPAEKGKSGDKATCGHTWDSDKEVKECPKCGSAKIKAQTKQKELLFEEWKKQKQETHWQEFVRKLGEGADSKVVVHDPELAAMKLETGQGDPKVLREVVTKYKEALAYAGRDPFVRAASIHMHLSQVYARLGEKEDQIKELREVLKDQNDPNTRIQLANLLIEQWETAHGEAKNKAAADKARTEAVKLLKEASEITPSEQNFVHTSIAEAYKKLGMKDEEAVERKKGETKPPPAIQRKEEEPADAGHHDGDGHNHGAKADDKTASTPAESKKPADRAKPATSAPVKPSKSKTSSRTAPR